MIINSFRILKRYSSTDSYYFNIFCIFFIFSKDILSFLILIKGSPPVIKTSSTSSRKSSEPKYSVACSICSSLKVLTGYWPRKHHLQCAAQTVVGSNKLSFCKVFQHQKPVYFYNKQLHQSHSALY